MPRALAAVLLFASVAAPALRAQGPPPDPEMVSQVGAIADRILKDTGVPSASVAIVNDGMISLVRAYGLAQLDPSRPAQPSMRYAIGSISKQFTAAAVLFLVEEGKLSLDDPVARFFPDLTRASDITIRMLLSHTSGYSDYWPQDYVMVGMMQPTTPQQIIDRWAKKDLDFEPGTKWQYSNTNYVIAGQIVEKLSGKPLIALLQERIFRPLEMKSVFDVDAAPLPKTDAIGYYRHALGPLRPAPKEGRGWLTATGELSMTAEDLSRWNISLINRSLLKPASYEEMFKEVKTKDGSGTNYGLGVYVNKRNGQLVISHGGEVSGFVAFSSVTPEARSAIVVLTNQDAINAAGRIAREIQTPHTRLSPEENQARKIFSELQHGSIDRSLFTPNCNAYFDQQAIHDYANSLRPLGEPISFSQQSTQSRGGMTFRAFRIHFPKQDLSLTTYETPGGKLEQYLISPQDR